MLMCWNLEIASAAARRRELRNNSIPVTLDLDHVLLSLDPSPKIQKFVLDYIVNGEYYFVKLSRKIMLLEPSHTSQVALPNAYDYIENCIIIYRKKRARLIDLVRNDETKAAIKTHCMASDIGYQIITQK